MLFRATIPVKSESDYRAIVVPQAVGANIDLLNITVDGTSYLFNKSEAFTFTQSKQHNFTITVNKRNDGGVEFVLTSESITAWENDNNSHDATAREYIVVDVDKAGTLKECIEAIGNEGTKIKNLKITGTINAEDFYYMRDEMTMLQSLNLKEVEIKEYKINSGYGEPAGFANHIPNKAFYGKKSLMRLVLPDKLTGIEYEAFAECSYLVGSLIIPEGVTEIQRHAFRRCNSMSGTLSLPTTLEVIGEAAFDQTRFIFELILLSSIKLIERYAFIDCP